MAPHRPEGHRKLRRLAVSLVLTLSLLSAGAPALADDYDPQRTGHPVRVAAYILHPIGVLLDTLIFRPAHWLGSKEGFRKLFGHTDTE